MVFLLQFGCSWFTFQSQPELESVCILFTECFTVDETCEHCVSGERRCQDETALGAKLYKLSFTTEWIRNASLTWNIIWFKPVFATDPKTNIAYFKSDPKIII